MTATLYHAFTNYAKGWAYHHINPVDVRKIINMSYEKRLFCLLDTDHKYTLKITYFNPRSEVDTNFVITSGGIGFAITDKYEETCDLTFRYKTENEILNEMNHIKNLQNIIKKYDNEKNNELMDYVAQELLKEFRK